MQRIVTSNAIPGGIHSHGFAANTLMDCAWYKIFPHEAIGA